MTRVVLDANVWYPKFLRDAFIEFGILGLVTLLWSERILQETFNALEKRHPGRGELIGNQIELLNRAFPDSLIAKTHEPYQFLKSVSPKDRHVASTALVAKADYLVTFNLKDFPQADLATSGLQVIHPDDFLVGVAIANPAMARSALENQLAYYSRPTLDLALLAERLEKSGCPKFAELVRGGGYSTTSSQSSNV